MMNEQAAAKGVNVKQTARRPISRRGHLPRSDEFCSVDELLY